MLPLAAGTPSSYPVENALKNLKNSFFQLLDDDGKNPDQIGNGNRSRRNADNGSDVIANSTAEYSSTGQDMIEQSLIASGCNLVIFDMVTFIKS